MSVLLVVLSTPIDLTSLRVMMVAGTENEKKYASKIMPLTERWDHKIFYLCLCYSSKLCLTSSRRVNLKLENEEKNIENIVVSDNEILSGEKLHYNILIKFIILFKITYKIVKN